MYYPYFRGKQYELIAIRENAHRMRETIVPIIEPVKRPMNGLRRAVDSLMEHDCQFVIIANPRCGEFDDGSEDLHKFLQEGDLSGYTNWSVGCIADADTTEDDIRTVADLHTDMTIIHAGFNSGASMASIVAPLEDRLSRHVFIDGSSSALYRRRFHGSNRVLIRDGFDLQRNRDYKEVEHFSDLHVTYQDMGMSGFGDFLIVGEKYIDTGGPAYAVAIHLTFIDPKEDNDMFVAHYLSDRQTSPVDPGGKFLEALAKLITDTERTGSLILPTDAVDEFKRLFRRRHYPGLGYVKKLSMQHHLELMAKFLGQRT